MKNIYLNNQVQTVNNKDDEYNNFDAISSTKKNEEKKEYDVWKVIGLYTYILFFVNIIYIITLIIYFNSTLDEETYYKCIFFIIIAGIFETQYILFSFCIFFCKRKIEILDFYKYFVILSGIFTFALSLVDFTGEDKAKYFTTTCKVIVILGSSLIMLLSLIYYIWACKLIYFNNNLKLIFIN